MKVCIIGGLQRREKEYLAACSDAGLKAKIFNELNSSFENSVKCTECVVFLTKLASHNMVSKAKNLCKKNSIPFVVTDKTSPDAVTCAIKEAFSCAGDCKDCAFNMKNFRAN